jgi:protein-S-isoprenylcysteine O-methyltransferase Ste14
MENTNNQAVTKRIVQILITLLIEMAILFTAAGTLNFFWAWVLFGTNLLHIIANGIVLPKELIAERGTPKKDAKLWDKILSLITFLPLLGLFIIGGLDQRFSWTGGFSGWLHLVGMILMVIGSALFTWAMVSNRFFSTQVRIQEERNHTVVNAGPYQIVRHPGYIGFILQYLSIPLILGSLWSFIPSGTIAVLFIIRTALEDTTLRNELTGYREYADKVKFRLLPRIW